MIASITVCSIILLISLWGIATSNGLIAKRNRVRQCRSGICVVIKQRNDMIPNLVATVKSYMGHENATLTKIAELRSQGTYRSEGEEIRRGGEISALLGRLNVAVENYPELMSNLQFRDVQTRIAGMENEIQAIRRTYNSAVTDYNNAIEMFPSSIIASWRHHEPESLIEFPETELDGVDVASLIK